MTDATDPIAAVPTPIASADLQTGASVEERDR